MLADDTRYRMIEECLAEMKARGVDAAVRLAEEKYGVPPPQPGRESIRDLLLDCPAFRHPMDEGKVSAANARRVP